MLDEAAVDPFLPQLCEGYTEAEVVEIKQYMDQDLQHSLRLRVEHTLQESQTPGATIAIYVNGQPFLEMGVGEQDLNRQVPLASDANFYIYSITKSLLATAALNLVKEGQLDLDTSVQPYLPNFSLDAPITLRQLLSHTSGLPDYGEVRAYFDALQATPSSPWSTQIFLNRHSALRDVVF